MDHHLFTKWPFACSAPSHYPEPILSYFQMDPLEQTSVSNQNATSVKFKSKCECVYQESVFENAVWNIVHLVPASMFGNSTNCSAACSIWHKKASKKTVLCYTVDSRVRLLRGLIKHDIIWSTAAIGPELNISRLNSQRTPHSSPSRASYGVSCVRIWVKIGRVTTAPHCISVLYNTGDVLLPCLPGGYF